jgi:Na+-driven multidrug efflux pump
LQVVSIPAMGLSSAAAALVGQNIGAGRIDRAEKTTILAAIVGFAALSLVGFLAWIWAPALIAFFVPGDPAVIEEGAKFVRITAPAWGFIELQLTIVSTFRAAGSMLAAMMLALVSQWVLLFPLAYVLSRPQIPGGRRGLWLAFPATNVLTAAVASLWFAGGDRKTKRLTDPPRSAIDRP